MPIPLVTRVTIAKVDGEFICRAYCSKKGGYYRYSPADYHTDSMEDAKLTREAMLREQEFKGPDAVKVNDKRSGRALVLGELSDLQRELIRLAFEDQKRDFVYYAQRMTQVELMELFTKAPRALIPSRATKVQKWLFQSLLMDQ